ILTAWASMAPIVVIASPVPRYFSPKLIALAMLSIPSTTFPGSVFLRETFGRVRDSRIASAVGLEVGWEEFYSRSNSAAFLITSTDRGFNTQGPAHRLPENREAPSNDPAHQRPSPR